MCVSPVKIKHPRFKNHQFLYGVDKEYIYVPCGNCKECQQQKQNDLEFRAYHEFLLTQSLGGFTLFTTFTYNNWSIPRYDGFDFFRKKDMSDFLKRLKSQLERDKFDVYGHLKYIITSEYGHKLFRPHMHLLFFVTIPGITAEVFDQYLRRCWKKEVFEGSDFKKSIGYQDRRNVQQRTVNSIYGLRYVIKYLAKDSNVKECLLNHMESSFVFALDNMLKDAGTSIKKASLAEIASVYHSYKAGYPAMENLQLFNFSLISHGLGESFLDTVDYADLFGLQVIKDKRMKKEKLYTLPSYYIRKVFYNYDKTSKRYVPNDKYKDWMNYQSIKKGEYYFTFECRIQHFINESSSTLSDYLLSRGIDCSSIGVMEFFKHKLGSRSFSHFARYAAFLHGKNIHPFLEPLLPQLTDNPDMFIKNMLDLEFQSMYEDKNLFFDPTIFGYIQGKNTEYERTNVNMSMYSDLPEFEGYAELCDFIYEFMKRSKLDMYHLKEPDEQLDEEIANARFLQTQEYIVYD